MQAGKQVLAQTVSTTDFAANTLQNVGQYCDLNVAGLSLGERVDTLIRGITILTTENVDWELWFFRTRAGATNALDTDSFIAAVKLLATASVIEGTGLRRFMDYTLRIPYQDTQNYSELHMRLRTTSAAGKAAAVVVKVALEPGPGV